MQLSLNALKRRVGVSCFLLFWCVYFLFFFSFILLSHLLVSCLSLFYLSLTCVPSVLFPSCAPISHQSHRHCPVPSVPIPAPHTFLSLACIKALFPQSLSVCRFFVCAPVPVPCSLCVPCVLNLFLVFFWFVLIFSPCFPFCSQFFQLFQPSQVLDIS